MKNKFFVRLFILIIVLCYLGYKNNNKYEDDNGKKDLPTSSYAFENIPEYFGKDYVILNNNIPNFDDLAKKAVSFEVYSELDSLGRANSAYASLSKELMPTEKRGSIGSVKPTGWHTIKYDFVDGKYLYNRCHLIGFQLAGENANKNNLITCTRYMNIGTMLEYENKVANYIRETNNHVLYRVTPIYNGDDLLAKGVQMEALSIEDEGKEIKFNIFVYNVQPGVIIDYKTGESSLVNEN